MSKVYFEALHLRLIATVREKVRNGELTERSLSRLTGVSQPHIHNVLKGIRTLSPDFADQVLRQLHLSILDLCSVEEMAAGESSRERVAAPVRAVPLLRGEVGPLHPISLPERYLGTYPFPSSLVRPLVNPVVVMAAADPAMTPRLQRGDAVLIDRSEAQRQNINSRCLYLIHHEGRSLFRYLRRGCRNLYLAAEDSLEKPKQWQPLLLANQNILELVRGRIVWIGHQMETGEGEPAQEAG